MSAWDDTIARVTQRLGVDPELQRDVARELQAHLEDSAAEFARGGQIPPEAAASALKALGDVNTLADDLWRANRRRMSWRAVARWMLQIATVPAAIAVIVLIVLGAMGSRPHLTVDQRLILGSTGLESPVDGYIIEAKRLVDRFPENPIYFAQYAGLATGNSKPMNSDELAKAIAILDRGERLEPDNGFYNIMKSALLLNAGAKVEVDPDTIYWAQDRQGVPTTRPCRKIVVTDKTELNRGLAELRRGLAKQKFTRHVQDMLEVRLGLFSPPRRWEDYVHRLVTEVGTLLPSLSLYRLVGRSLCAQAIEEARSGNMSEAESLLGDADRLALKSASGEPLLLTVLSAQAMRQEALGHAQAAYEILGRPEQARAVERQRREDADFYAQIRNRPPADVDMRRAGMFWQVLMPSLPGYAENVDFEPMRTTEQWVAAELALVAMLGVVAILLALLLAKTLLDLAIRKRANKPILLLLSWRTLGRICLLAVILPLSLYGLYVYLTPGSRSFGLNYMLGKVVLEWVLTFAVVMAMLSLLGGSAIRHRAEAIGLEVPPSLSLRRRWVTALIGGVVLLIGVAYLVLREVGAIEPAAYGFLGNPVFGLPIMADDKGTPAPGVALYYAGLQISGLIILFLLGWLVREIVPLMRKQYKAYRLTLVRSLVPVVACAVILIGTVCGLVTAYGETQAAQRIRGNAEIGIRNEVERSDYRLLRDRYEQMYKALPPMQQDSPE